MAKTKQNENIELNKTETVTDIIEKNKEVVKKEVKPIKKVIEKPKNDELILCRSCVLGELYYKSSKTGQVVIWSDMGAEEYLEFGELITMKSSQSRFLNEPWIMIDDERVINYLGLKELYAKINDLDDISDFFKLPLETMGEKLKNYPTGLRKIIGEKAREMVQNDELYDIRVIDLLKKELNIELEKVEE